MKKRGILAAAVLLLAGGLLALGGLWYLYAGGGTILPSVPDEEEILAALPEDLLTVALDEEPQTLTGVSLTIQTRETNQTRQVDDVTCLVTLEGEYFTLTYTLLLHYGYVRSTGWSIRDYEQEGEAALTFSEDHWPELLLQSSLALLEEGGYSNPLLQESAWDPNTGAYCQTFSVREDSAYLTTEGSVTVSGSLSQVGTLAYRWTVQAEEGEVTCTPLLEGAVWYLLEEEETIELALRIDTVEEDTLTLTALIRAKNSRGATKQTELTDRQVTWTVTEHGCIVIPLTTVNGSLLTCYIQEEEQWVTTGTLYLARMSREDLPASGKLAELMTLELTPSIWERLLPDVQEQEETETGTAQTQEDSSLLTDFWEGVQSIWNSLWN